MSAEALRPLRPADAARFAWIDDAPIRRIVDALLAARPASARFVGGCVRDGLLGASANDVDLATQLRPEDAVRALEAASVRVAPTGFEHGTVTAVAHADGRRAVVEVTSLRADVATDGRRAVVAFTDDWARDASRRDFTINALYLTPDRRVFDPTGGLVDLAAGRVRFIGAPAARLREDYLRILRFFRFSARFARGAFDQEGLAACAAAVDGLARLSKERIGQEFGAILAHATAPRAVEAMAETGALAALWSTPADLQALRRLKAAAPDADAPAGLAALWGAAGDGLMDALRLSRAEETRRAAIAEAVARIPTLTDDRAARALVYAVGTEAMGDGARIVRAARWAAFADAAAPPTFPLRGKDAIALGAAPGPRLGESLAEAERRWIAEDFPSEERALEILTDILSND